MHPLHEQAARYLVDDMRHDASQRRVRRRIKAYKRSHRRAEIAAARAIHAQSLIG